MRPIGGFMVRFSWGKILGVTLGIVSWSQTQSSLGNITPARGECNYYYKLGKGVNTRSSLVFLVMPSHQNSCQIKSGR